MDKVTFLFSKFESACPALLGGMVTPQGSKSTGHRTGDESGRNSSGSAPAWAQAGFDLSEHELLRGVVAESPVALYVVDRQGLVRVWNPATAEMYGWSAAEAVGRRLPFVGEDNEDEYERLRGLVIAGKGFAGYETTRRRRDGTSIEVSITTVPLRHPDGTVVAVLGVSVDLTGARQAAAALVRQANRDALTDLPNRTAFLDAVAAEMGRVASKAMLVYLDLDDFKDVNDTRGHRVGDEVLRLFAERLRASVRPHDVIGRLGGDEFAALLTNVGARSALTTVTRMLAATGGPYSVGGRHLTVHASAGLASCQGARDAEEALGHADVALYQAKRTVRGGVAVFDQAMQERVTERVELAEDLQAALDNSGLEIYYQPIFSLLDQRPIGVEALARWAHPRHGWVPPDRFIPLAEQTGTIRQLGRWVLDRACAQLSAWQVTYPQQAAALTMSVNLSAIDLQDPPLVAEVKMVLAKHDLIPHRLCLEVTETALADDLPAAQRILKRLRRAGVGLAIDDFGTGHSSLTLLRQMPFGILKIDRSFVAGIGANTQDTAIVAATLDLAHTLGLRTLAEGIETEEQLHFLVEHGCQQGQGYLLARPAPPEAMHTILSVAPPSAQAAKRCLRPQRGSPSRAKPSRADSSQVKPSRSEPMAVPEAPKLDSGAGEGRGRGQWRS